MSGRYDFKIDQKRTFRRTLTWRDGSNTLVNLTNKTATLNITDGKGTVLHSMTQSDGIALGGTLGTITLTIPRAANALFTFDTAHYDLDIITGSGDSADPYLLLEGIITLNRQM